MKGGLGNEASSHRQSAIASRVLESCRSLLDGAGLRENVNWRWLGKRLYPMISATNCGGFGMRDEG